MILFFGPAGAGKSMQGQLLGTHYNWPWVSTGKMLRETNNAEIQARLQRGELISDDEMYVLLEETFTKHGKDQWILDGFPRTKAQAEWLVTHQEQYGYSLDLALVLDVNEEEVVARMQARGRADDTPEAVAERLRIFHEEVEPILTYLAEQTVPVATVNGIGRVGAIHDLIDDEVQKILG
jgi:adenylate kinase